MRHGEARRIARGGLGSLAALWLAACPAASLPGPVEPGPGVPADEVEADPAPSSPPQPRDPPRLLTDPGSGVRMVWNGAAARAAVADRSVVVLEPDLRHLGATDWRDGEARWRIEQPISEGAELFGLGDRVLVHDRDRALVVEAARGRVLGRHPAPPDGPWPYSHRVDRARDACAWVGPCGIQAFDCTDGRPLGAYLPAPEIHLYGTSDDPREHSTSCHPSPRLLGRHGGVVVMKADLPADAEAGGTETSLVGLDAGSGQVRWRRALPSVDAPVGMTDDGGCWLLDEEAPRIEVLQCEDGTSRWWRTIGPGDLEVQAVGEALVVGREYGGRWRMTAYATDIGRPGWSVRLARRQRPVLPGGPLPEAQITGKRRLYALVDPTQDGVVGNLMAGRDERLWLDPAGGFVLTGREFREHDATGQLTRQRPFSGTRVHTVTTGHMLTQDNGTIAIYDREQLRERARLEGRLTIESEPELPADRLLLMRHGDDGVALVLALEPATTGGVRR